VVVVALVASGGGGGSGGGASGPKEAVEALLKASQNQDLDAAKSALCRKDQAKKMVDDLSSIHVVSYRLGSVEKKSDYSVVHTSMVTTDKKDDYDGEIPAVEEDGAWKVCFSSLIDGFKPDIPTTDTTDSTDTSDTDTSESPPTEPGTEACDSHQSTAFEVADRYAIFSGDFTGTAQACVYEGSVPEATTKDLIGHNFTFSSGNDPGPYTFKDSKDGSTLTVTVTEESDGKYWVTDATVS
jgi:hypothetical protein